MNQKKPDDVTFQVTVSRLTLSSRLAKQDLRVTLSVGDVSKITCSGHLLPNRKRVVWSHPFLFTAHPSAVVVIAVHILPRKLAPEWDKLPLGDNVVTSVASLLECGGVWQCNISGLLGGPAILYISCKASDLLIMPDGHDCLSVLKKYEKRLYSFARQFKNTPCVTTQVEVSLAMLDFCPFGHTDHTGILKDLAVAYAFLYDQQGNISDLNRAIAIKQTRLNLCPLGHLEHADALGELALSLGRHYNVQENKKDLNKLIEMQECWLNLCPSGHLRHAKALGELATSLWKRYNVDKDITDLNRAIKMQEKVLDLCSEGNPGHDTSLNNLAQSIRTHYGYLGDMADLQRTVDLQEKCLQLRPPGHKKHGLALKNLALTFWDCYSQTGNYSDLHRSMNLFKKALETYPPHHSDYAFNVAQLAMTILHSSKKPYSPDYHFPPLDEAFETYRLLKRCGPAASMGLWNAAQAWVKDAEEYNHPSALEAYQTSLITLDHFTSLNSSLDSRHETMQTKVADLANNAFSCAIRNGNLQTAVELLEQGRGILWNQLARFDTSIAALQSQGDQGRDLGNKLTRLSADLRKFAQRGEGDTDAHADPYWQVQEEWRSMVDNIRRLDGFSRFLLPPRFDHLQQAAEYGPIIIVNASEYGCDALIVLYDHAPIHLPLGCSLEDIIQPCSQLSELTRDSHAYGAHRELYVKEVLRDLWSLVVKQITSFLQNDIQLPLGSRIWWCPTSKFTMLPFHAAGPHDKTGKNLMDLYVSSYAPSLSALLRARDRLRAQREAHDASGAGDTISFAAVGQACPSADTKLGDLPEVEHELERIRNETGMPPAVKFETVTGAGASIEGAVQAFRDHRWVHVACHGSQHATKPFDSWFAMGDGKLTLMRIIQERYVNSEFAFLSACHTAVGDASTPDEVLHLAAGMQFAGFKGVIGTLWRVDDAVAHRIVTRFYKGMFKGPVVRFERAAAALNTAALETTDGISLEKRIVFVHIGI